MFPENNFQQEYPLDVNSSFGEKPTRDGGQLVYLPDTWSSFCRIKNVYTSNTNETRDSLNCMIQNKALSNVYVAYFDTLQEDVSIPYLFHRTAMIDVSDIDSWEGLRNSEKISVVNDVLLPLHDIEDSSYEVYFVDCNGAVTDFVGYARWLGSNEKVETYFGW